MTDLTLFVIGFGIFGLCIGGTLAMSIGGSQPREERETKTEVPTSNKKWNRHGQ